MKKYLKALLEGFGIAFTNFLVFILPICAIYVFIEVVPKLTGWLAAGTAIIACAMLVAGIGAMIYTGLENQELYG